MSIQCSRCQSVNVRSKGVAKRIGQRVGGAAGTATGVAGAVQGASYASGEPILNRGQ